MSSVAVSIEGLGKKYRLGQTLALRGQTSFREVLAGAGGAAARLIRRPRFNSASSPEEFWALRDVSFDVQQGEVFGIVGRNGAGKSTLLKILSRITDPTEGRVTMRGRIASLLEVGTGFHPELTGRENIFLNGAILGMTRSEVRARFDEIVDFAGTERFLETPVKRYSSGMYMRLAFAVAAHLNTEIMVIDEVLAVGDQEFQAKCLGKMNDVRNSGRTVLFVSHNLAAVRALCNRAALLQTGRVIEVGTPGEVLARYRATEHSVSTEIEISPPTQDRPFIGHIKLLTPSIAYGESVEMELEVASPCKETVDLDMHIFDETGARFGYFCTEMTTQRIPLEPGIRRKLRMKVGPLNLAVGSYDAYLCLYIPQVEWMHDVKVPIRFRVHHSDPGSTGYEFRVANGFGAMTAPIELELT
jgi:lipopolysaccharide transport system ATP-binding protein